MDKIIYRSDEWNPENIDEYIEKIVQEIVFYYTYFECCINWFNKDWLPEVNKRREKYKDYKDAVKTLGWRNYFFRIFNFQSKRFEYFIYVRSFLDTIRIYLKKNHKDYKRHKEMWESSKYLQYYVYLIFKTGFYNGKVFDTNKKILEEIKILNSFLSKPLHAFSVYYESQKNFNSMSLEDLNYEDKEILKAVNSVAFLTFRFYPNNDIIKYPIDPNVDVKKQECLNHATFLKYDDAIIKDNLKFWKDKCLEEFDNKVKFEDKNKNSKYSN